MLKKNPLPELGRLREYLSYSSDTGEYFSKIEIDNKTIWLGKYKTAEEAHEAYLKKAKEVFGDFVTVRGQV